MADRAEPLLPRGRELRPRSQSLRAAEAGHASAPPRGQPARHAVGPADARADLALGDPALAEAPRADPRARAGRRCRRRLHRPDEPLPRHPGGAARSVLGAGRLLRRRRADEPARVRRHGHRVQLLPRCRSGRVRPRGLELRRRPRAPARARRTSRGGGVLGRRPRALPAPAGRQAGRRLLLRVRRQVPAGLDGDDGRRAEPTPAARRLRARRARLPRRHRCCPRARRRAVQRLRPRDLGGADQPQHHASSARVRRGLVDGAPVRAGHGRRGDRLQPVRGDRALVRAGSGAARRVERGRGDRRLPRAARRPGACRRARSRCA